MQGGAKLKNHPKCFYLAFKDTVSLDAKQRKFPLYMAKNCQINPQKITTKGFSMDSVRIECTY